MHFHETQAMIDEPMAGTQTMMLAELQSHDVFCTPLEARFDRLTRLARASLGVPVAAITARAGQRLWFKSVIGWEIRELTVAESLCERTLSSTEPVIVEDTLLDDALARHRLVAGHPKFRFYAGQSVCDQRNQPVGTFDVYDTKPHTFDRNQRQALHDLVQLARRELLTSDMNDAQNQLMQKLSIARREAQIDPLTKTWNRRATNELLKTAIDTADSESLPVAVCAIDVDKFKAINDTHGHPVGDLALRRVAANLSSSVRDNDAVCRIGGDEFLIIMKGATLPQAEDIAKRIRSTLCDTPLRIRTGSIAIHVSTGIAVRNPGTDMSAEALIEAADAALYKTKRFVVTVQ